MPDAAAPKPRNAQETRARIIEAAQAAFSEKGYSQAGLRDVAARAGVASSLLVKYFGTKANLFGEALTAALVDARHFGDRADFGRVLVASVLDPQMKIDAPAMIALAIGDADARAVAARVMRDHVIEPVSAWLGPPDGRARAADMLMLTMGLVLFGRYLRLENMDTPAASSATWLAATIQAVVDGPAATPFPDGAEASSPR